MKKSLIAFSIVLLAAIACDKDNNNEPQNYQPQATIVDGDFTFNIVKQLNVAADGNFFLSPISVQMAFAMLANGADGNSRQQILDAFGYSSIDKLNGDCQKVISEWKKLNEDYANINAGMGDHADGKYQQTIETANAIWTDLRFPLYTEYIELCNTCFDAEASTMNFANVDSSLAVMNGWCNQKTHGMIPEMLEKKDFNPAPITVLANALYFKSDWEKPFKVEATQKATFTDSTGSTMEVDMMHQQAYFDYVKTENYAMAELPYSGSTCMDIILPNDGISVSQCVDQLSQTQFETALGKMSKNGLNIYLPKFDMDFNQDLIDILKKLGVIDVFDPATADLSKTGSCHEYAYVGRAFQLSRVSVDENGTTAAAVTVIVEIKSSVEPQLSDLIEFNVNRPFAYIIRDKQTGVILFVGKVEKM